MRILRHYKDIPAAEDGTVLAIGNFDGVHRGHQVVITRSCEIAAELSLPSSVLTFEPHPRIVLRPDQEPFRLTSLRTKAREMAAMGVKLLIVVRFDLAFAAKPAEEFVRDVLLDGLRVRHVIVGFDFVFGHRRAGDTALLARLAEQHGFGLSIIEAAESHGEVFASSQVRRYLAGGLPERAAAQLGRWWEAEGRVRRGAARGAGLGFPTANLKLGPYLCPALGIYAARVMIESEGEWRDAVAYVGPRPTFGGEEVVLEVHVLDFNGDLYGRRLRVALVSYLRGDKAFDGVASLKAQIGDDCGDSRRVLADPAFGADRYRPATAVERKKEAAQ